MTAETSYTVRDASDDIVASGFDTEAEAIAYASDLANAKPDECYGVYGVTTVRADPKES